MLGLLHKPLSVLLQQSGKAVALVDQSPVAFLLFLQPVQSLRMREGNLLKLLHHLF